MNNGWIKLYRKIQGKGYYKKSKYVHLWVHLLLKANHKENEFMWNDKMTIIKQGQLLTGRKQLSDETGINESSIERILKMLENEQQIEQQKTTKFRIITIKNWENYQSGISSEQQKEQQANNKRTTSEQQLNTNKNDKNDKNDNNKELFDIFRKAYPGKKRGLDTEYNDFIKKHKDYKQIIPLLPSIIEDQISAKKKELDDTGFTPMWKNLKTWLSQRCWEEEFGKTEAKPPTLTYKEMQEILIPMDAQQKIIFQKEYTFEPNNKIYTRK